MGIVTDVAVAVGVILLARRRSDEYDLKNITSDRWFGFPTGAGSSSALVIVRGSCTTALLNRLFEIILLQPCVTLLGVP